MKKSLITIIIVLAIIVFAIYALNKNGVNTDVELAKCIGAKTTLYMQTGCPACKKQESLFGETYKYLNVIDCLTNTQKCIDEEITNIPTWFINGNKYIGVQSIEKLKELTGC